CVCPLTWATAGTAPASPHVAPEQAEGTTVGAAGAADGAADRKCGAARGLALGRGGGGRMAVAGAGPGGGGTVRPVPAGLLRAHLPSGEYRGAAGEKPRHGQPGP